MCGPTSGAGRGLVEVKVERVLHFSKSWQMVRSVAMDRCLPGPTRDRHENNTQTQCTLEKALKVSELHGLFRCLVLPQVYRELSDRTKVLEHRSTSDDGMEIVHIGNMSFFKNDDTKMWFFDMQCVAAEHCMRDIDTMLSTTVNYGRDRGGADTVLLGHLNQHLSQSESGLSYEETWFSLRMCHSFWCLTAFVHLWCQHLSKVQYKVVSCCLEFLATCYVKHRLRWMLFWVSMNNNN